ncbi:MAG: small subunit ribosomal protein S6 [Parcubacteria group bacterium Gr01-1014_66]|nr:MAG: small subunit ribosomal protein S6 [Parcubacteria group bacterium Gr01-1014_66]
MARESQLYEIGVLLKPELSVEEAAAELGNVRMEIENRNGILESTADPKLHKLAYPIKKSVQAYFAALQFSISPAAIAAIEKTVSANKHVLRSLVLSWTRAPAKPMLQKPRRIKPSETPVLYTPIKPVVDKDKEEKVDEQELDKKLDEILGS